MRHGLGTFTLAGLALTAAVLSAAPAGDEPPAQPTMAVQRVTLPLPGLRDEAAMVLVGTALIGLAAAVRRAG